MQLSITVQGYDKEKAAELVLQDKKRLKGLVYKLLQAKQFHRSYIETVVDDIMQDAALLLLTEIYDCGTCEEAVTKAIQEAVKRELRRTTKLEEVPESVKCVGGKDRDSEVSHYDLVASSKSAEEEALEVGGAVTLLEAIDLAESRRYIYGQDTLLAIFLHTGAHRGFWPEDRVGGLLVAFSSASPTVQYTGDEHLARVLSLALYVEREEFEEAMHKHIPMCEKIVRGLGA